MLECRRWVERQVEVDEGVGVTTEVPAEACRSGDRVEDQDGGREVEVRSEDCGVLRPVRVAEGVDDDHPVEHEVEDRLEKPSDGRATGEEEAALLVHSGDLHWTGVQQRGAGKRWRRNVGGGNHEEEGPPGMTRPTFFSPLLARLFAGRGISTGGSSPLRLRSDLVDGICRDSKVRK